MKVSVLGAGAWGTTLAVLLHYNGHRVTLWEYDRKYTRQILKHRENKTYLPGIKLPEELLVTHDLEEASTDKNLIVLAVPSQFLRSVVKSLKYGNVKNLLKKIRTT